MTIRNVTIGDKFIDTKYRQSKRVSEVTDFIERRSMKTGEVIDYECVASHEFMGQILTCTVPFATVARNRVAQ
jgi:hypothetical protein